MSSQWEMKGKETERVEKKEKSHTQRETGEEKQQQKRVLIDKGHKRMDT